MPDGQRSWMRPDTRVYPTRVAIEGDASELKTGMNCQAEIMIEHLEDAVYVPIQSIYSVKGVPTAFVKNRGGIEQRSVVLGNDNGQVIHIVEGLSEGEDVLLSPPLDLATKVDDSAVRAISDDATFVSPAEPESGSKDAPVQTSDAEPGVTQPDGSGELATATDEERRQRFMNMSEDERAKFMQERMAEMTPEQRGQMRERMRQSQRASGGGSSVE